jgi:hypothetical protein
LAKVGAKMRLVVPGKRNTQPAMARLNLSLLQRSSTAKASPRRSEALSSDRRSLKGQERAAQSAESISKAQRELMRRKNSLGGKYHPF